MGKLYKTLGTITASPDLTVPSGSAVVLKAGTEVILTPEFEATAGSEFTATIEEFHYVSGIVKVGDAGFGGQTLTLSGQTAAGEQITETTVTAADGSYSFYAENGTYTLLVQGYDQTLPLSVNGQNLPTADLQLVIHEIYYHHDLLGNTVALTDSSGQVLMRTVYLPFGDLLYAEGLEEAYLFTGKERDATGMDYFGARHYDPALGRFMGIDPAGGKIDDPQSWNLYAYCLNNPYKYVDPDGENAWDAIDVGFFLKSAYSFAKDPGWGTGADLALNTVGLLPLVPSIGSIKLVGKAGSKVVEAAKGGTEIVQRAMTRAESEYLEEFGTIRFGKEGTEFDPHFVSDAVNSGLTRARLRLALPKTPEVRVTLEVEKGIFGKPSTVKPLDLGKGRVLPGKGRVLPGGGTERTATGVVRARVLGVDEF